MKFPSAIWTFRDSNREQDGYLFVDAVLGRIIPVTYSLFGNRYRHLGYGLWFHDLGDYEIATTHIWPIGSHKWMHEYYRIYENWMQWSNPQADIIHELVSHEEIPEGYIQEYQRLMNKSCGLTKPDYNPENVHQW